jgi:hypothetical protein
MHTRTAEIADGIFRLSTFVPGIAPPADFTFNQFLVLADEPLMFHSGLRRMFQPNLDAVRRILPPERLRWIRFGHFESDECGALNDWLGDGPALTTGDIIGPAIAGEDLFRYSSLNPGMGATIRRLAALEPRRLALMHGPAFEGDGAAALHALADDYDRRLAASRFPAWPAERH